MVPEQLKHVILSSS